MASTSDILYHYTSSYGLIGILSSKKIWATQIQYLNDSQELSLALTLTKERVKIKLSKSPELSDEITIWLNKMINVHTCVFSLSEKDDLLSQWRGYCPPGNGYAIGFDKNVLLRSLTDQGCSLESCVYDEISQHFIIDRPIENASKRFFSHLSQGQDKPKAAQEVAVEFLFEFFKIAPRIKSLHFAEEQEWRVISNPISYDVPGWKVRPGNQFLIPYFELDLGEGGSLPFREIVIGPSSHPAVAKSALENTLKIYSISCDCRLSEVPYRER